MKLNALVKAAAPALLLYLLLALLGTIPLVCAGRLCGAEALLVTGTAGACMIFAAAILGGLAQNMAAAIWLPLQRNDTAAAGKAAGLAVRRIGIATVILVVILELAAQIVPILFFVPYGVYRQTIVFLRIGLIGTLCFGGLCIVFSLLRGADLRKGLLWQAGLPAVVAECILCPILAVKMGVLGIAAAMAVAMAVGAAAGLLLLRRRTLPFTRLPTTKEERDQLVTGGKMSVVQNALVTVSFLIVNGAANHLGTNCGAGYAAATGLLVWLLILPAGLQAGTRTLTREDPDHRGAVLARSLVPGAVIGVVLLLVFLLGRTGLMGLFCPDTDVVFQGAAYLQGCGVYALPACLLACFSGSFAGTNQQYLVRFQTIFSALVFRISFSLLLPRTMDIPMAGLGYATPIAACYGLLFSAVCFFVLARFRRRRSDEEDASPE